MKAIDVVKIEEICKAICDKYCKYPYEEHTEEEMDEICKDCPLNDLD